MVKEPPCFNSPLTTSLRPSKTASHSSSGSLHGVSFAFIVLKLISKNLDKFQVDTASDLLQHGNSWLRSSSVIPMSRSPKSTARFKRIVTYAANKTSMASQRSSSTRTATRYQSTTAAGPWTICMSSLTLTSPLKRLATSCRSNCEKIFLHIGRCFTFLCYVDLRILGTILLKSFFIIILRGVCWNTIWRQK